MKEEIFEFVKKKVNQKLADKKRPLVIHLNEVTNHFGPDAKPLIRELIEEKKLFWGHTINSFWLSTYKKEDIL